MTDRIDMPVRARSAPPLRQPIGAANSYHGEWLLFQRADDGPSRVYYPETAKSMCMAFDLAWKHLSVVFADPKRARSILAVQILHHVNRGEHNVERLATAATEDLYALISGSDRRLRWDQSISAEARVKRSFVAYRALREA